MSELSIFSILISMLSVNVCLLFIVAFGVWERRTRAMLDEIRKCNDDFVEAAVLMKAGATDEALVVAQRWKTRLNYREPKQ